MNDPKVSLIIPSRDGDRGGRVARLLDSIHAQTFTDYEICLIRGVFPQGRAINQGSIQAKGDILIVLDDDSELADNTVLERIVATLEEDATIGMAGASIVAHPSATPFQLRAAQQFPRFSTPVVDTVTDSDLACHGCCGIPRRVFEEIGGEREDIMRGLDPDLRARLRDAGYRVVLAPHARIHHPLPEGRTALLKLFVRNGFGSAHAWKFHPDSVYETHEELDSSTFASKRSLAYRALRMPMRIAAAFFTGRSLRALAYSAYACGYVWGLLAAKPIAGDASESGPVT